MSLKLCFWNINGLSKQKYEDDEFTKIINKYDICLTETWQGEEGNINKWKTPDGFKEIRHARKQKHKKAKRLSGGIMILYKSVLQNLIKLENKKDQDILWIKLDKSLLDTKRDLLLGTAYISPKNNSKIYLENGAKDTFTVLYDQLAEFGDNNPIKLGGDFNARTSNVCNNGYNECNNGCNNK